MAGCSGCEADCDIEIVAEGFPDQRDELRSPVGNDVFREPVVPKYMVEEVFCCFQGGRKLRK